MLSLRLVIITFLSVHCLLCELVSAQVKLDYYPKDTSAFIQVSRTDRIFAQFFKFSKDLLEDDDLEALLLEEPFPLLSKSEFSEVKRRLIGFKGFAMKIDQVSFVLTDPNKFDFYCEFQLCDEREAKNFLKELKG